MDQNTTTNETPIAKKKWETPQLIFISSGDVQGGGTLTYIREGSFIPTGKGLYHVVNRGGTYSDFVRDQYAS
jgi:hypothetical protein